jgi:hypothetical protein
MNIAPLSIVAAGRATDIVRHGLQAVAHGSQNFLQSLQASSELHGLSPSSDVTRSAKPDSTNESIEPSLQPLRDHLHALGYGSDSKLDLITRSDGQIDVDAEPGLRQTVERWLSENKEWADQWRASVRGYLQSRLLADARGATVDNSPLRWNVKL